jgi:hypothetical protein
MKIELTEMEWSYLLIELNVKLRDCSRYGDDYAKALNGIYKKITGADHLDYIESLQSK